MNRPSYKELLFDERKDREEQLRWIKDAVNGSAKFYREPPYSYEEELAREIMQMHVRIAELEAERHWTPVSEGLPEIGELIKNYDAIIEGETEVWIALWDGLVGGWFLYDVDSYLPTTFVTHWRERPTPPEVQE